MHVSFEEATFSLPSYAGVCSVLRHSITMLLGFV